MEMFNKFFEDQGSKTIIKWIGVSLMLFSAFLFIKIIAEFKKIPSIGDEVYPNSTIMVTGEGEAFAIPDTASFSFSVNEAGESVAVAQKLLDDKVNQALKKLDEFGVEKSDIKTTGYNVYPKYEWEEIFCITYPCPKGKNKLIGYEVTQSISVKVKEIEKAGDLVNQIGAINVSNISGVEFIVDNREEFVALAREQAIEEAKAQAKILAKQLGVRLGKVIYFNENGNYPLAQYDKAMGMGGGEGTFSPSWSARAELPSGETKITSQVSITYEIK